MTLKYYIIFILLLSYACLSGQESVLYYHELNSQGKLSQTTNEFVFQDSRGFTWISSIDGLNRYDGINVEVYKPNKGKNSIEGHIIQSNFFEDNQGNIWFCTYEAINCYRPKTNDFSHFQLHHKKEVVDADYHVIHFEKNREKLWVKIGSAILTFDTKNHTFSDTLVKKVSGYRFLVGQDPNTGKIRSIWAWSFHGDNLSEIYNPNITNPKTVLTPEGDIQKAICISPDSLWVLSNRGIFCISRQTDGQFLVLPVSPIGLNAVDMPLSMLSYHPGQLLFWMPDGSLLSYHIAQNRILRKWHLHAFNPLVRSELIGRNMYLDPQKNIWLSIPGLGLRYANLNRKLFEFVSLASAGSTEQEIASITTIGKLKNGNIYVVEKNRGFMVYVPGAALMEPENSNLLQGKEIFTAVVDASGLVYLFTNEEIFFYDYKNNQISYFGPNTSVVFHTSQLSNNQVLALTYLPFRLMDWSVNRSQPLKSIKGIEENTFFRNNYLDRYGTLFLSRNSQYILAGNIRNDSFVLKKKIDIKGLINGYVEDTNKGLIWVASTYGLYTIDQKTLTWQAVSSSDQSTQQYILSMLPDRKGQLWLSTNNGLWCFNPRTKTSKKFSVVDGLPDIEFTLDAGFLSQNGKMFFGTRNGLVHFNPLNDAPLKNRPKVILLEFSAKKQNRDSVEKAARQGTVRLPHKSNSIVFRFLGIEYSNPLETKLLYKIEPIEKEWTTLSNAQGRVQYAHLNPGHYTLKLKAMSADDTPGENELKIAIIIAKPFYLRTDFLIFGCLFIVLLVYAWIQWRLKKQLATQRAKQVLIEAERNRMMEDLHDGIGFDLTAIKAISEKSLLTSNDQVFSAQFEKVFNRAQDAIRTMGEVFRATDEQYSTLGAFLNWVQEKVQSFMQDVEMGLFITAPTEELDTTIGAEARQNLWLVIKETLNNMAKHSGATQASLAFKVSKDQVIIEIQDNGKGFDPDQLRKGRGMRNMPKRMKNIGGSFEILTQSKGTLVKLSAPINKINQIDAVLFKRLVKLFTKNKPSNDEH